MKLLEKKIKIDSIWKLNKEVIFESGNILRNTQNQVIRFDDNTSFYCSYKFICNIKKDRITVFDESFDPKKEIFVEDPVNVSFYEQLDNYLLRHGVDESKYSLFLKNELVKEEENITGVFLNAKYRLHLQARFKPIRTFRCSDLLDTKTDWEYNCAEGEHVRGGFTAYEDKLLFYTHSEPAPYEYYYWVNVLDLHTGETLHKIPSRHIGACFDERNGLFVAVSGSIMNQQDYKVYEIIDVNTGKKQIGDISCEDNFVTVGTAMQHIYENRLYFIDNFITIGGKKYCENPKIGCFDFIKRELIYFKEIPDFKKKTVAQIIRSDDKIYIRTQYFELYIFEEEN